MPCSSDGADGPSTVRLGDINVSSLPRYRPAHINKHARNSVELNPLQRSLRSAAWNDITAGSKFYALKGHFTHMKLFFKITEIETMINITYIVRFLRSTDVSVFYY